MPNRLVYNNVLEELAASIVQASPRTVADLKMEAADPLTQ